MDATGEPAYRAQITALSAARSQEVSVHLGERALSYAEVLTGWQRDAEFRSFFIKLLADAPYQAYLWETPAVTSATTAQPFTFVVVDSPWLAAAAPDALTFAGYFANTDEPVAAFANLGGDALLVVPAAQGPAQNYTHLAAFARGAPVAQQHALWQRVGSEMSRRLGSRSTWLSSNGSGVHWLHLRLDRQPKYYSHRPYRSGL